MKNNFQLLLILLFIVVVILFMLFYVIFRPSAQRIYKTIPQNTTYIFNHNPFFGRGQCFLVEYMVFFITNKKKVLLLLYTCAYKIIYMMCYQILKRNIFIFIYFPTLWENKSKHFIKYTRT